MRLIGHSRSEKLCHAEVENLEPAIGGESEVSGFQVAMDYILFVGRGQTLGELRTEGNDLLLWQRRFLKFVIKRYSGNIFHHQEIQTLLCIEVMDGGNVGVVKLGERQGLIPEAAPSRVICEGAKRQNFDGYFAIQVLVVSEVNHTHTTAADSLDDAVVRDGLAD